MVNSKMGDQRWANTITSASSVLNIRDNAIARTNSVMLSWIFNKRNTAMPGQTRINQNWMIDLIGPLTLLNARIPARIADEMISIGQNSFLLIRHLQTLMYILNYRCVRIGINDLKVR
jgi:hypothetical protein